MGNPRLTIESVISTLDRVANGSTRYPGKRESIGEHHRIERECRDRLRAALGDMSATLDRIDNLEDTLDALRACVTCPGHTRSCAAFLDDDAECNCHLATARAILAAAKD